MGAWGAAKHGAYCAALFLTVAGMEMAGRFVGDTPKNLAKCLVQVGHHFTSCIIELANEGACDDVC